jgi:hypothetical protein
MAYAYRCADERRKYRRWVVVRQWSPTASWIVLGLIELARVNHIEAVV